MKDTWFCRTVGVSAFDHFLYYAMGRFYLAGFARDSDDMAIIWMHLYDMSNDKGRDLWP